ncbi:MAG: tRNA 2-thiocytidine(32) synthetase TtcA, partial [Oricola sp.]
MNISTPAPDDLETDACHPLFSDAPRSVEFNKLRKRLLRNMRQALDDFSMVKPGERWLVGLSGGKDS